VEVPLVAVGRKPVKLRKIARTGKNKAFRYASEDLRSEKRRLGMDKGKKSAVLRVRRLSGKMLTFLLGAEDETLREFAESSKTGRAAKTLVKQGSLRITLVALKKGTVLPPHQVTGPVSIQTIRGCLRVTTDREGVDVTAGTLIALAPAVAHTAKAHEDCSILLTFAMP
jgi:quercetin dioxygenase-like cupin family protein